MARKCQLRGQKLLNEIEAGLKYLANKKEKYTYNASELSRHIGCSRPTLNQKASFIDEVLIKIGAEKRLKKTHPSLVHLNAKIDQIENENATLKDELNALRIHHANIYSALYMESVDASILIKPIVKKESIMQGKCILCGEDTQNEQIQKNNLKIIHLHNHQKPSNK